MMGTEITQVNAEEKDADYIEWGKHMCSFRSIGNNRHDDR